MDFHRELPTGRRAQRTFQMNEILLSVLHAKYRIEILTTKDNTGISVRVIWAADPWSIVEILPRLLRKRSSHFSLHISIIIRWMTKTKWISTIMHAGRTTDGGRIMIYYNSSPTQPAMRCSDRRKTCFLSEVCEIRETYFLIPSNTITETTL